MGAAAENVLSVAGSVSLLTWAGHLVAVWILGIVLGWLVSNSVDADVCGFWCNCLNSTPLPIALPQPFRPRAP